MDREVWCAAVHRVARVRHDLATEQEQQSHYGKKYGVSAKH